MPCWPARPGRRRGTSAPVHWADEARVFMCALGQQAQHVLGPDDCKQVGLGVAVEGGKEHPAARLDQRGLQARMTDAGRARARASPCRSPRRRRRAILPPALRWRSRGSRGCARPLPSACRRATPSGLAARSMPVTCAARARHRLGQDAAPAAHVEHRLAAQAGQFVDPAQAQRVDLVQRPELAVRVPPAVGKVTELGEFLHVDVLHGVNVNQPGCHSAAQKPHRQKKPRRSGVCLSSGPQAACLTA
jgi:hypothetical protein